MAHSGIFWEDVLCQEAGNTDLQDVQAVVQVCGLTRQELRKEGIAEQNDQHMP